MRRDEQGQVLVIMAALMPLLLLLLALAADIMRAQVQAHQVQTAVDAAALAGAREARAVGTAGNYVVVLDQSQATAAAHTVLDTNLGYLTQGAGAPVIVSENVQVDPVQQAVTVTVEARPTYLLAGRLGIPAPAFRRAATAQAARG